LNTLEDISYSQSKQIPKVIFERLKANTRDISEIIRDLKEAKSKAEEFKDAYEFLKKQHDREGKMTQEVLRKNINERKKLREIIKRLKKGATL
jgi:membrane protein involved in colicin uptake